MAVQAKNLLPIGSVIWLKDARHALMIIGVKQTLNSDNKEYDYMGVPYPEGNMGPESQFVFMHENIEKIDFTGYSDAKREEFLKLLEDYERNSEV